MKSEVKPLFQWRKDGIYIMFGPYYNRNITLMYMDNPENVVEYLQNLLDADIPYRTKHAIKEVIEDLENNY